MPDPRVPLAASLAGLDDAPGEALRRLAAMGYRGVQIPITAPGLRPRDLDGAARRALRGALRRMELVLAGLDLWIPSGHFVDPQRADRAAMATTAAIELAADLDRVGVSLALPVVEAGAPMGDVIASLLARAERHGVDLVDHSAPPQEAEMPNAARWRIGVDLPAWLAAGPFEAAAVLLRCAPRLGAVRLSDLSLSGMRAPIADSACAAAALDARLDVPALAAALSVVAPSLTPVADPRQWADPWDGLEQTLAVWGRALSGQPGR